MVLVINVLPWWRSHAWMLWEEGVEGMERVAAFYWDCLVLWGGYITCKKQKLTDLQEEDPKIKKKVFETFKSQKNKIFCYFPRKITLAITCNEYFSEEKKQTQLKQGNKKKKRLENLNTAKFQMICSLLEWNKSLESTSSKGNEDVGNERHSYTFKRQTQFVSISSTTERCCVGSCQTFSVTYFYISGAGSSHSKLITSNNNLSWVIDFWIWKVTSCILQIILLEKPAVTSTLLWHRTCEWGKGDSDPSGQQPPWCHCSKLKR